MPKKGQKGTEPEEQRSVGVPRAPEGHGCFTQAQPGHFSCITFTAEMPSSFVCNYSKACCVATVTGAALKVFNNVYLEGGQPETLLFLITEHMKSSIESYVYLL